MKSTGAKERPCKAPTCGETFVPTHNTTQAVCSPGCALELVRHKETRKAEAEKRKQDQATRAHMKQRREALKTRPELEKPAQRAFNWYIRVRDHGRPCPTCDRPVEQIEAEDGWRHGGAWDCGHILSRGAYPEHRFNTQNAMRQCKSCNAGEKKGGRHNRSVEISERYEQAADARWGAGHVQRLKASAGVRKYSRHNLRRIAGIFRRRARLYQRLRSTD